MPSAKLDDSPFLLILERVAGGNMHIGQHRTVFDGSVCRECSFQCILSNVSGEQGRKKQGRKKKAEKGHMCGWDGGALVLHDNQSTEYRGRGQGPSAPRVF